MEAELRIASPGDWEDFKTIRLHALADSPTSFGTTLSDATAQPDTAWRDRLDAASPTLISYLGEKPVAMGGLFAPEGARDALYLGNVGCA